MKIIDDKGNLFGKLNIIDVLIVLIIIIGFFGINYKLGLLKKVGSSQQELKNHTISIWIKDISKYTADAINVGDSIQELRSNLNIGTITHKEVTPHLKEASDINGKWVLSEIPERYDVIIKFETSSPSIQDIKLGSIDAKVGASITVKGPKFQVNSFIIGVE